MKLAENKWPLTALAVLLGALMLTRGGLASLGPLLRFAAPVLIIVLAFRVVKGRFKSIAEKVVRDIAQGQQGGMRGPQQGGPAGQQRGGATGQQQVIDLCPKCGAYMNAGHKCKR